MSSHGKFDGGAVRPEREVVGARSGRGRRTSAGKLRSPKLGLSSISRTVPKFIPCPPTKPCQLAMHSIFPPSGPSLPSFQTLLIAGPLPASAPIHLCLSHLATRPHGRAVILTPSAQRISEALTEMNDVWLNDRGGNGSVFRMLLRTHILCGALIACNNMLSAHRKAQLPSDTCPFKVHPDDDEVYTIVRKCYWS